MKQGATASRVKEAPTRVCVVSGVRPSVADVVFTSAWGKDTPGRLTSFVLRDLGLTEKILPSKRELRALGVAIKRVRGRTLVFVNPHVQRDDGYDLSRQLAHAHRHLPISKRDQSLWIPLLAQWTGDGLTPSASMMATAHAIYTEFVIPRTKCEVIISLWEGLSEETQHQLQDQAEQDPLIPVSRSYEPARFTSDPEADLLTLAFHLALARKLRPQHLLNPDLAVVASAVRDTQSVGERGRADFPAARRALAKRYSGVNPNALWLAWMRHTMSEELSERENQLRGEVS